jgi:hypothetical protein
MEGVFRFSRKWTFPQRIWRIPGTENSMVDNIDHPNETRHRRFMAKEKITT